MAVSLNGPGPLMGKPSILIHSPPKLGKCNWIVRNEVCGILRSSEHPSDSSNGLSEGFSQAVSNSTPKLRGQHN